MADLIEKIRAAIDEDERIATDVIGERWYFDLIEDGKRAFEDRFTAERVLRQVAAHRKILDEHLLTVSKHEQLPYDPVSGERIPDSWDVECARCGWCGWDPASGCPTVLALAEDYGIGVESGV